MAYFAMLSGQGWTAIAGCRQFFYARYADWLVTTPLIIILLGLVAGAGYDVVAGAIGCDGAYTETCGFEIMLCALL
jgi:bacteriorhodopsin